MAINFEPFGIGAGSDLAHAKAMNELARAIEAEACPLSDSSPESFERSFGFSEGDDFDKKTLRPIAATYARGQATILLELPAALRELRASPAWKDLKASAQAERQAAVENAHARLAQDFAKTARDSITKTRRAIWAELEPAPKPKPRTTEALLGELLDRDRARDRAEEVEEALLAVSPNMRGRRAAEALEAGLASGDRVEAEAVERAARGIARRVAGSGIDLGSLARIRAEAEARAIDPAARARVEQLKARLVALSAIARKYDPKAIAMLKMHGIGLEAFDLRAEARSAA